MNIFTDIGVIAKDHDCKCYAGKIDINNIDSPLPMLLLINNSTDNQLAIVPDITSQKHFIGMKKIKKYLETNNIRYKVKTIFRPKTQYVHVYKIIIYQGTLCNF